MGWYDDFLNEAVRQDLGKSGIKVAETVEIQRTQSEWWRLISSASPATVRGFAKRHLPVPIIEGDAINVDPFSVSFPMLGQGAIPESSARPVSCFAWKDGVTYIVQAYGYKIQDGGAPAYEVQVHTQDGAHYKTITVSTTLDLSTFKLYGVFWDNVNQRIITLFTSKNKIWCQEGSLGASSMIYRIGSGSPSAGVGEPKVFEESPNDIYNIFRQTGVLKVKKVSPTSGQTAITIAQEVFSDNLAVTVSGASNYRGGEAFLFYSRSHESVAIAWVDATNTNTYYAVESESWGTTRLLSTATAGSGITLDFMANLVFPDNVDGGGEYYVLGRKKKITGTIATPPGYSYPANLAIFATCEGDATSFRVFGTVGTNWYVYYVDYESMEITKASSGFSAGFDPGSAYGITMVGSDNYREIYILQVVGKARTARDTRASVILCIDKSSGEILWAWGNSGQWSSSAIFPNTYGSPGSQWHNWKQQTCLATDTSLYLMQHGRYGYVWRFEHYRVSITDVLGCASASDFTALLTSRKYIADMTPLLEGSNPANQSAPFFVMTPASMCKAFGTMEIADQEYFLLTSQTSIENFNYFRFDRTTGELKSVSNSAFFGSVSNGNPLNGAPFYDSNNRCFGFNFNEDMAPDLDSYCRIVARVTTSYDCQYSSVHFRTYNMSQAIARSVYQHLQFTSYGYVTIKRKHFAHWFGVTSADVTFVWNQGGSTFAGNNNFYKRITIPFTPTHWMVSEFEDKVIFLCYSEGSLSYYTLSAYSQDYHTCLAIKASDFAEVYPIDFGRAFIGGIQDLTINGGKAFIRDYSGDGYMVETGATLSDGVGGGEPGGGGGEPGGAVVENIYEYEDLEFIPYPFAREGIRAELSNISKTTQVTLPETQDRFIQGLLSGGFDPRGSRCILRRIFPDHAEDEGGSIILLDGYIQEWTYSPDRQGIIFTVSKTLLDVNNAFPKRLMNMGCGHVFRGDRCQYVGATGLCPKTKAFCTSLGNVNQFGGFPWVAARQRRVMWR